MISFIRPDPIVFDLHAAGKSGIASSSNGRGGKSTLTFNSLSSTISFKSSTGNFLRLILSNRSLSFFLRSFSTFSFLSFSFCSAISSLVSGFSASFFFSFSFVAFANDAFLALACAADDAFFLFCAFNQAGLIL